MNRLTKLTSAAFGMALLAGLAYYQGNPALTTAEESSLVGTAVNGLPDTETKAGSLAVDGAAKPDCDPSKTPDDPDFEDCDKISQK